MIILSVFRIYIILEIISTFYNYSTDQTARFILCLQGLNEKKYSGNYSDNRNWFDGRNPISSKITQRVTKNDEGANYSYNWTGYLTPHVSGTWYFRTSSDDSSHLWLDDIHVVNNGGAHGARSVSGNINLIAGQSYAVQITHEEYGGGANMNFYWTWLVELKFLYTERKYHFVSKTISFISWLVSNMQNLKWMHWDIKRIPVNKVEGFRFQTLAY